jgi:hypothetical protein
MGLKGLSDLGHDPNDKPGHGTATDLALLDFLLGSGKGRFHGYGSRIR